MSDYKPAPLPEPPGMTEINPYRDLGTIDPHAGKEVLTWYSADQMHDYAAAEVARAVADEREAAAEIEHLHAAAAIWEERARELGWIDGPMAG